MKLIDKDALVAEIERLVNNQDSALDYEAALEDVRNFLNTLEVKDLQEEPTFKVGDRIRIKGTTVKGDVIKNIYQADGGNTYFEFENSDDALANEMWELVKEFKPIKKKQPEGVLKELLDNMDKKELEETRKEMLEEDPVSDEVKIAAQKNSDRYAVEDILDRPYHHVDNAFEEGAKWQRQKDEHLIWEISSNNYEIGKQEARDQIMKNAIEVEIVGIKKKILEGGYGYVEIEGNYKVGDKIKILVIKEE